MRLLRSLLVLGCLYMNACTVEGVGSYAAWKRYSAPSPAAQDTVIATVAVVADLGRIALNLSLKGNRDIALAIQGQVIRMYRAAGVPAITIRSVK